MCTPGEWISQAEGTVRRKGNEARMCPEYSRNRKDISVQRTEEAKCKGGGNEVRKEMKAPTVMAVEAF